MKKEELTLDLLGKALYVISYLPSASRLFSTLVAGGKIDLENYVNVYVLVGFKMMPSFAEFRIMVSQASRYDNDFDFHKDTTTWNAEALKDCFTSKEEALEVVKARLNETIQQIKLASTNLQSL